MDYLIPDTETLQIISAEQAWHYRIIPQLINESTASFIADKETFSDSTQQELEMLLGLDLEVTLYEANEIQKLLSTYYRREAKDSRVKSSTYTGASEDFVVQLIKEAKSIKSSDIHIESYEEKCRVRLRIDGMLVERYSLSLEEYPSLINKIKIMSNLDISEKRLPQDGRIFFKDALDKFDIRVSILPTLYGEKVVMRILSNDATDIDISYLGMQEQELNSYLEGIKKPNGILLISGPTGSGKTTTLYATLKILNKETRNVLTIEDPIEYTLEGINQVQLKESIGLDFASALRTFLRQDPDVIMVGEIRDKATANMAIRAALTGHLVLSTIHTNSAWGTVSRLIDMEIPPFLVANTLNTTVAQRLVRLLCDHCKKEENFDHKALPTGFRLPKSLTKHMVPVGCESCYYTGYKGRKAVYEVLPIDNDLSEKIK